MSNMSVFGVICCKIPQRFTSGSSEMSSRNGSLEKYKYIYTFVCPKHSGHFRIMNKKKVPWNPVCHHSKPCKMETYGPRDLKLGLK